MDAAAVAHALSPFPRVVIKTERTGDVEGEGFVRAEKTIHLKTIHPKYVTGCNLNLERPN